MAIPDAHHATILVIDDDPAILEMTRDFLTGEGYRIIAAATHDDAVTALSAFRCDLVLSDTGGTSDSVEEAHWAAPERIRSASHGTPVVIFSAHDPRVFDRFHERGFAGVIAKPFDLDALLETVKALLTRGQETA